MKLLGWFESKEEWEMNEKGYWKASRFFGNRKEAKIKIIIPLERKFYYQAFNKIISPLEWRKYQHFNSREKNRRDFSAISSEKVIISK